MSWKAKSSNITEFGLFVAMPGDIDGMVHMSDLDWSRAGEEAIKDFTKGQTIKVKVLEIDADKERISLGIKQLTDDPFEGTVSSVKKGEVVTCTITAVNDGGIEVSVGEGFTGFIKKNDLSRERSEQRPERFAVGEKVDAKVTTIDRAARKISLSIKAREVDEDKKALAEFGSVDSGATLGDILGFAKKGE
jgi:small subunit ribosomal protein S1